MPEFMNENAERHSRRGGGVVAALLIELLKVEAFDSYAELAEALKIRCARLRIPYDSGIVTDAIAAVEGSRGRRVVELPIERRRQLVEREPEPAILDRATAAWWLDQIDRRLAGERKDA
jgi:hypothetical protein